MKKYVFILFALIGSIHMTITPYHTREWDAHTYAQGNQMQESAALHFLHKYGINFTNKKVLDVGCGIGNISVIVAQTAEHVHGIDASNNMIGCAKGRYSHVPNVSFEHAYVEDFTAQELFDAAYSFFCLHWVPDKKSALTQVNMALELNGEFFGALHTDCGKEPMRITIIRHMMPLLEEQCLSCGKDLLDEMLATYTHDQEFRNMFNETGFELISYEYESQEYIKTKEEIELFQKPIIMSFATVQAMPQKTQEWFFKTYIDLFLTQLPQNNEGNYILKKSSTVFYARKIADV